MRTTTNRLACIALATALSAACGRPTAAQDTIVLDDAGIDAMAGGGCLGRATQSPPWHGSVAGDPCGPCCPPPNVFHADPCRQLWMKHNAHQHGCVLPPCFPRMHARLTGDWWPTPRPIKLPRCPNCGAHIDPGM